MGMSGMYGPADERESIATIHAALDRGVTLLDTGDYYGAGHNEMLIGRALRDRRDAALLSVKFGALRGPDGSWIGIDARPAAVKNFIGYTLKRLGVDHIDIYRPGRLDPAVPIEDTVGAIADLIKAGYVRAIGLSEVGAGHDPPRPRHPPDQRPADRVLAHQPRHRRPRSFRLLAELGIGVTAYGVLSRGLLSGSQPAASGDFRAYLPRFSRREPRAQPAPDRRRCRRWPRKGVTASQLAIAWVLAKGATIVPVIGARTRTQLAESLGALESR